MVGNLQYMTKPMAFSALRGKSGEEDYVVIMASCEAIDSLLRYAEEGSVPESWRVERPIRAATVSRMVQSLTDDRRLPLIGIVACIDKPWRFKPASSGCDAGQCSVPANAKIVAIDGGQALAAMRRMLPALGGQTLAVTLLRDPRLSRCQGWHRRIHGIDADDDLIDRVARTLVAKHPVLKGWVEWNRSALSPRSKAMFTYSAIRSATRELVRGMPVDEHAWYNACEDFWNSLDQAFPEWSKVRSGAMLASEMRAGWIHSHGVVTQALAVAVRSAGKKSGDWNGQIARLDWKRSSAFFEGSAIEHGKARKSAFAVAETSRRVAEVLRGV